MDEWRFSLFSALSTCTASPVAEVPLEAVRPATATGTVTQSLKHKWMLPTAALEPEGYVATAAGT